MRIRVSASAREYMRQEASYLRRHSQNAADSFIDRIKTAFGDLTAFAEAGFEGEDFPVPNMRRLVRGGYRIDYKIKNAQIWIVTISSSVNTPLGNADDHDDYEVR